MLSAEYWNTIQRRIRGAAGHTLGLAALDSDVQRDLRGAALLHFTPLPTPGSKEVDVFNQDLRNFDGTRVNAYVFLRLRWFLGYCVFSRRREHSRRWSFQACVTRHPGDLSFK